MKAKILDLFISELDHSSPETRRVRRFWAEKFLQFAPDGFTNWNKSLVYDFEARLRHEGYALLTIRDAIGIVKRVFDAAKAVHEQARTRLISEVNPNDPSAVAEILQAMQLPGPQWDLGKRAMPRVAASDITRPALTLDEIKEMVAVARNNGLELPEVCYLALASIYGLRRGELRQVRREHIDFSEKTIFVNTVKGGEKRKQLLCDEIIPYLKEYSFNLAYSPFMMSRMWKVIRFKCGFSSSDGEGWHSQRRALDTMLVDACGELAAHMFLRWKLSSSTAMELRYYSRDPLEVDAAVLSKHPVVPLWG